MEKPEILIVHQCVPDDALPDEKDVLVQAGEISKSLINLGYNVRTVSVDITFSFISEFIEKRPYAVFNLVETFNGNAVNAHLVPLMLEQFKIPVTGNSSSAIFLTTNKVLTKDILLANNIPTANWHTKKRGESFQKDFYIFKPVSEDASIGITNENLKHVENVDDADRTIEQFEHKYKIPFFCEKFIDGREFNVSVVGNNGNARVLFPAEMIFFQDGHENKILCYDSKWNEESEKYDTSRRTFDLGDEDRKLIKKLKTICERCWKIFNLSGYVRVDFRVDKKNNPYVLEINANPCLSPDSGLFAAAQNEGLSYKELINIILVEAENENKRKNSSD
ncbi:MAG TPA: ATP-grasp domain-containing protein [bacterium]|nr:ATP-grasp domain-containing protein [bacterium]HPS29123.1 ATP-grasp domain-containing protein [bacterium]